MYNREQKAQKYQVSATAAANQSKPPVRSKNAFQARMEKDLYQELEARYGGTFAQWIVDNMP